MLVCHNMKLLWYYLVPSLSCPVFYFVMPVLYSPSSMSPQVFRVRLFHVLIVTLLLSCLRSLLFPVLLWKSCVCLVCPSCSSHYPSVCLSVFSWSVLRCVCLVTCSCEFWFFMDQFFPRARALFISRFMFVFLSEFSCFSSRPTFALLCSCVHVFQRLALWLTFVFSHVSNTHIHLLFY